MDDIIEAILEIIWSFLDRSYDSGNGKKHRKLLILTASIGIPLCLLLLVAGILDKEEGLILCAILLLVLLLLWLFLKIREHRKYH